MDEHFMPIQIHIYIKMVAFMETPYASVAPSSATVLLSYNAETLIVFFFILMARFWVGEGKRQEKVGHAYLWARSLAASRKIECLTDSDLSNVLQKSVLSHEALWDTSK